MTEVESNELDVRIAVEVMGYVWTPRLPHHRMDGAPVRDGMVLRDGIFGPLGAPGPFCSAVPHYSTDITSAWLVVEKLRQRFGVGLHRISKCSQTEGQWTVEFCGEFSIPYAQADTAPLAICQAALKAVSAPGWFR